MSASLPTVGVLIRFANSAQTLPAVLEALKNQTLQPNVLLGVENASSDGSRALIEAAGGRTCVWPHSYDHAKVLNFGLRHLTCDLVLILSSHTVLEAPDTLARMVEAMVDPASACVSGHWDDDPFYSDAIGWKELQAKGLKFGSIYSNSMGMIRRSLWEELPFDESLTQAEDYDWAISQAARGFACKRLRFPFSYRRSGATRDAEFAQITFQLARKHGLRVTWLGVRQSLSQLLSSLLVRRTDSAIHLARLRAWWNATLSFREAKMK